MIIRNKKPKPIKEIFGPTATLERSLPAYIKLFAIKCFVSFIKTLSLFDVKVDSKIDMVDFKSGFYSFDFWKENEQRKIQERIERLKNQPMNCEIFIPEFQIEESDYEDFIIKQARPILGKFIEEIGFFYEFDRDCFYEIDLKGDNLRFIKGIDFKFLPYYEQKFNV